MDEPFLRATPSGLRCASSAPTVPMRAALTALGAVSIDGGVVDGRDPAVSDPSGLCADGQSAAGISVADVSKVTCTTCASSAGSGVFGTPPVDSSAIADSSFADFGDETAATLAARASITLPGGAVLTRPSTAADGECDRADPLNWGDPSVRVAVRQLASGRSRARERGPRGRIGRAGHSDCRRQPARRSERAVRRSGLRIGRRRRRGHRCRDHRARCSRPMRTARVNRG